MHVALLAETGIIRIYISKFHHLNIQKVAQRTISFRTAVRLNWKVYSPFFILLYTEDKIIIICCDKNNLMDSSILCLQ